jgi:hypothetical protein
MGTFFPCTGMRVLELVEHGFDVAGHGDVDIAIRVVPFDGETPQCNMPSQSVETA